MKVLQISSAPIDKASILGGGEKVILELSKELSKKHTVHVLQTTLYYEGEPYDRLSQVGKVKIITCKNDRFLGGLGYSKEFKLVLKKIWKEYDLVHIHGHGRFTSNFSLKFLKGKKPLIYTAHGFFHSKKHQTFKKLYDLIYKKNLKNAKFCTALTDLEVSQYLKLGVSKDKIKIIPNGVELKNVNISKPSKEEYLKKLKLNQKNKTLLYVGGINESKGLQYVVKAIKDLEVNFLILGKDRGFGPQLKEIIKKEHLQEKVKFLENVDDKEKIKAYSVCDAFVLFSEWEGFGLVALEAMIFGKPIIGSDRGALPKLIENNKTGFIIEYPDVNKLKEKIKYLLDNYSKLGKMRKAEEKFANKFTWDKITKQYEELYKEAIKNGR